MLGQHCCEWWRSSLIQEYTAANRHQAKLGENGYGTPEEMFKQLHLVFLNAKHCEHFPWAC